MNVQRIERGSVAIFWVNISEILDAFKPIEPRALLNQDELEKYLAFSSHKRKLEFLAARLLWKAIGETEPILYRDRMPYLLSGRNISISHTNKCVGIAISTSRRIGLDFEQVGGQALKLLPRFLNAEEQERFSNISELEAAQIWSFKEAAFKYFSPKKLAFVKDISIFIGEKSRYWAEIRTGNSIFELPLTSEMVEDHLISYNLDDAREKT